jgi:UDP-N-acetylglucosamine/UDP-N-acetylgalactosamine diphosphorylase
MADRWLVMESPREEEFSPVKNADGVDSPTTAKQAMSNQAARWLEAARASVPRNATGDTTFPLEISPRFALDESELLARVWPERVVDAPLYLE